MKFEILSKLEVSTSDYIRFGIISIRTKVYLRQSLGDSREGFESDSMWMHQTQP